MTELVIDITFGRLAARVWGDPANPPMLALHGWLDNAASFAGLAPMLADHYIVALDFAGHGRSDHRTPGSWYHHVDHVSDVLEVVNQLDWLKFSLLGHSMGASIASIFAAAMPERIERLLLIEGLGPPTAEHDQTVAQLHRALLQRASAPAKILRVFADIEVAIQARITANGLSRQAAQLLVERGIKPVAGGFSWSSDPRLTLASPLRYSEPQILAILRGIRVPSVLVMADPPMPYFRAEIMQARIAAVENIRVIRVPGTHHLHLEQPAQVAPLLR
jgi:pimeloyl-ACP methyl ester carboxylesterase